MLLRYVVAALFPFLWSVIAASGGRTERLLRTERKLNKLLNLGRLKTEIIKYMRRR